jgi:uncharacterized RDD family membrane protein YckC
MGDADSTERKPKYVWDPQKLAWVEQAEPPTATPVEEVAVVEEVVVETPQKKVTKKAPSEVIPVEVTAEAEGMQYRGAPIRLLAFAIDFGVVSLVSWILGKILPTLPSAVSIAVFFIYFVGFWWWRGQTLGKMLIRAKVVRLNGSRIGLLRSLLRFVVYFLYVFLITALGGGIIIYIIVGLIASLVIAFTKKKRGLHDLVAGTVVINSRPPKPQPVEAEAADDSETAEASSASEGSEPTAASEPETEKQE